MKAAFESYLISMGYKTETPSGHPSTVYDYIKRIDRVCQWEHLASWENVADNIDAIISAYDVGGDKQHLGNKSHHAVINALKRFSEFLQSSSCRV